MPPDTDWDNHPDKGKAKAAFDKGQDVPTPNEGVQDKGSGMVKADAPHLQPRPSGPMRDGPDQAAYTARLDAERLAEAAERRTEAWRRKISVKTRDTIELNNDRDKDRDERDR